MTRGLRVPVGVNSAGQAQWVDRDEAAIQTIAMALSDNSSENAFLQGIGLAQGHVFSVQGATRAEIMARIFVLFDAFEKAKLYRLQRETVRWQRNQLTGEEELFFEFVNLESDKVVPYTRAASRIVAQPQG